MNETGSPHDGPFLEKFRRTFKTAGLAGIGLIAVMAVFLAVAEIIRAKFQPFFGFLAPERLGEARTIIRFAVYGASVLVVVFLRLVNGLLLRSKADESPEASLARLFRANIVALSLAEIPALLGFMLFLAAGFNRDFWVLLFVSLFLFFMYFPRLAAWEDFLARRPRACRL